MTQPDGRRGGPAWPLIGGAALLQAALHAASIGRYGLFRDELYYLSCASRPAPGYVDQPAFSILFLAAWRALFGDSALALMVPPALCGAVVVVLTGLLARRLGGGPAAQGLAAAAAAGAPIWVAMTGTYSMNAFDILFWTLAASLLARILEENVEERYRPSVGSLWLALGAVLGLGLLNKISVLWLGAGIFAGLVLTPARRWLPTRGPWLAGGLAFLGLLPYLVWNAMHRWPTLEFMRRAAAEKYVPSSPLTFARDLLLFFNPLAAPLWVAGLVWLLAAKDARRFRLLGVVFLTTLAILLLNRTSKTEYLAASFAPLVAAGGVALERVLHRGRSAVPAVLYASVLLATGLALAPLAVPLLSPAAHVAYAARLGLKAPDTERTAMGPLPQHFADRFGWPEMAAEVARVAATLTAEERKSVADARRNAPLAGPFVVIGGSRDSLAGVFRQVEEAGKTGHPLAMPYENGRTIWICRDPKQYLETVLGRDRLFI